MRTQQPHASQRDAVVPGGCDGMAAGGGPGFFPGRGLCCPDDPLDLVLQLFPAAPSPTAVAPDPSSLAALGIGTGGVDGGEPPRPVKQEPESPQPPQPVGAEQTAFGGGVGGGLGGAWDSWVLSSFALDGLCGLDEIDVDMFFADDDALDDGVAGGAGGGEATTGGDSLRDATDGKPTPAPPSGDAVVVPNDASSPLPAGAFQLQAYDDDDDACRRAFHGAVSNHASPPPPPPPPTAAPMPSAGGGPLHAIVTNNNSTPPALPALIMPLPAAAPAPIMPLAAAPAPASMLPAAAGLHACDAFPTGIVSNGAPAAPPPPPPPLMAPMTMPAHALLHPNAALAGGIYSSNSTPVHAATPSWTPPSGVSSGSSSSATSSEPVFLHPRALIVPRKQRSPPAANRRKRPWLLDFPLRALPPVVVAPPPPPANPAAGGVNDDDAKNNLNAAVFLPLALAPPGNGNGNTGGDDIASAAVAAVGAVVTTGDVRRRRPAPRQRNRQAQRVCSHCHSPETPQWRAGPDGPGTLCNACGIRYAANRLLPEYRPSTAPSFRSGQHSNRHRKVMKLREQQMMMKAAPATATEEKPAPSELELEQPMMIMEDDADAKKDDDDDGFIGACTYISSAPGLL